MYNQLIFYLSLLKAIMTTVKLSNDFYNIDCLIILFIAFPTWLWMLVSSFYYNYYTISLLLKLS